MESKMASVATKILAKVIALLAKPEKIDVMFSSGIFL